MAARYRAPFGECGCTAGCLDQAAAAGGRSVASEQGQTVELLLLCVPPAFVLKITARWRSKIVSM